MNEFEDLLNSVSQVETGDVVSAEVLTVDATQANVAISGTGVEGVLTLRELTNDRDADINDFVKVGEVLDVLVLRQVVGKDTDTVTYLVSKKRLEARKAWDKLVGREEEVVTVKGTRAVKGGLSVEFEGVRGFIPASMLDTRFVRNTERFVGQEFDAKIKEVDAKENRFILSRREVVEAATAAARAEVFGKLAVGDVVTGKVARITSFGAFIDLGGVDGLVHLTELSHERNVSPKSVVTVGEEIEVKILDLNEEEGRVSLSLKATTPGPWDGVEQKLAKGDVVEGTVKRLTDFGAFVEVLPGIDGLVHVSQISHKRIENPKEALKVGQEVKVKVLEVNADAERVSLSIKALEERPAQEEGQKEEKRAARPRRPKRQEKRDFELPETQTGFSMADLFGDIEL
ncbi:MULTISPECIES: 30S ribosomal protein S1 [Streptococcus]|jgi:40S ribosomal protein S1|uniref:30S ribosomal protein S1 n=11 Tax=Streptococcus TaxID=1301 RepID=A0A081SCD2_STRMT|nr:MULTISPECIES: 30S ribosomal protein S1 [Streptococcus]EGU69644.1 30S ribosomal protein S1 [Streptococcus mitis SK569]EID24327.1 30S ribosomal protein S1 [Streptococcus mitis SK616]EID32110.1 30S ribosomal protein S1 [Streptococcus mitis SK579]EOB23048.1 30S ribosomal protein S1 [Streptococcus mitis 11/5]EPR95995.1 30S ribosomal protein S1 [Streptococcus mitis 29/42]EPR96505.1 30S ribosomal protein S1 [Streptococcus mitis 18/56]MDS4899167.1 30S ribosomal protein S1 [Streptococcus pneumonia